MENELKNTFSFGEFEIDATRRLLLKNGETVNLNPKALEVLLALVENRGRVVSKDELLDTVWENQFVEENNLTVHIAALRKALGEKKDEHRYIVTVPGKGYKFVAQVQTNNVDIKAFGGSQAGFPTGVSCAFEDSNTNSPNIQNHNQVDSRIAAANNLEESQSLFGRERELAEIKNLLRGAEANLITLTGTGGTGKTSLARAVAGGMTADFPDGIFFVELAAVSNAELVVPAIAQTLDLKETGGKSPVATLKDFLRDRKILLVLDNFEQLVSAAAVIKELLCAAPLLKILMTSRAALRIEDEREFFVSPLAVPPNASTTSIENLTDYAAIELYVRRAQITSPDFQLNSRNAPVVTEICRRLDGLPLAIELAAARTKLLSPQAIFERLDDALKLLSGGGKILPVRQRTMRAAIKWSYDLLDDEEKELFARLGIFVGNFSIEAAEKICDLESREDAAVKSVVRGGVPDANRTEILDLLASLLDNNLLVRIAQPDGSARLRMLEVVREFAAECFEASPEKHFLQKKHAAFFLALAEEAEPHLTGEQSIEWLGKLEIDVDNLRAALFQSLNNDAETATRLTTAMRFFWINRSQLTEGVKWLKAALDRAADAPFDLRFKLLSGLGVLKRLQGDYDAAAEFYGRGLTEGRAAGDKRQIALAGSGLGTVFYLQRETETAKAYYEEGLAICRELKDDFGIAAALNCLGVLAMENGEKDKARLFLEESLEIFRRLANKEAASTALNILGAVAVEDDHLKKACKYFTESLTIALELENKINIADSLNGFAALAAESGEAELAVQLAGASIKLHASIGYDREPYEQQFCEVYLSKARSLLSEKKFAEAFERGQNLNLKETVALCRGRISENGVVGSQEAAMFIDFGR